MNNSKTLTLNQFNIVGKKVNIDKTIIKDNFELEEIVLKNFIIDDTFINILNSAINLKNIWFINCNFSNSLILKNVTYLRLHNCKNMKLNTINEELKYLDISAGERVDIEDVKCFGLTTLKLNNVEVINLSKIEKFEYLENLYLQKIELNQIINYCRLSRLKKVDFNGSKVDDREKYVEVFKDRDIQVSFENTDYKFDK